MNTSFKWIIMKEKSSISKLQAQKAIISEGITLSYYHSRGEKDIALILIHGMGSTKDDFLSIFNYDEFTPYQIIFADLVGHGDSSSSPDFSYSMDHQAQVLYQFLDKFPVNAQIVLIPHSMGGPIAFFITHKPLRFLRNRQDLKYLALNMFRVV